MIGFLLRNAWAFIALCALVPACFLGAVVLVALAFHREDPAMSAHADALRSLKGMHPGPRSVP